MNKRLTLYIEELFVNEKKDRNILDIKEELLANLNEKYEDLIASGSNEEEAFTTVIGSIGDIQELIGNITDTGAYQDQEMRKKYDKKSVCLSFGAALYILGLFAVYVFDQWGLYTVGISIMLLLWAAATGIIVYGVRLEKYEKKNDTFVENYKEKLSKSDYKKQILVSASLLSWAVVLIVYFVFSFTTWEWAYSWIIFLAGAFFQLLIIYFYGNVKKKRALWSGMIYTIVLIVYFIISFAMNAWIWSWIIFLLGFSIQQMIKLFMIWRNVE